MTRLKKAIACVMTLALLCASCAAPASAAGATSLTVGIVATNDMVIRPLQNNQRDVQSILNIVYEGLFYLDDNYLPQPLLAYSYEFANEGRRLIVNLREDVYFHNGQHMTAEDVIATLNAMWTLSGFDSDLKSETALEERGLYYSTFYALKAWEADGNYRLVFTLRRASYGSLYAFTFPILPASQVFSDMPCGTGPYAFDGYEPGSAIWLAASKHWWKRTPQIRNIRASILENTERALTAFDQQQVDVTMSRSINASRYASSLSSISMPARTRQLEVLLINRASNLFKSDDKGKNLVRQAIGYAINRSDLINAIYQGMATVAYTPVPSGLWFSDESTVSDPYDPLMAASLLDSAGWKLADDGKRYKNGEKMRTLRLLVYDEPGSTVRTNAANRIKTQLEAVGFSVSVVTWSREDVTVKLRSGDYTLALCAFNFDIGPDPGFTLSSTASCNYTRYRSDTMNQLITSLRSAWTYDSYADIMRLIQKQFVQDMPYVPLYWRSAVLLSRSSFTDARDIRELELLRGVQSWSD